MMSATLALLLSASVGPAALGQSKAVHRDGLIVVMKGNRPTNERPTELGPPVYYLMINRTYFGNSYVPEDDTPPWLLRKPTTYYHQRGIVGHLLGGGATPEELAAGDARRAASVTALAATFGSSMVSAWAEPPIAVVGMHTGTIASYARPFQIIDFYERDPKIVALSKPPRGGTAYFRNIQQAIERGARVRVFEGDVRTSIEKAPKGYYQRMFVEMSQRAYLEDVETELITVEGLAACLEAVRPDGVVALHTSSRYLNLPQAIGRSAKEAGARALVVKDEGGRSWGRPGRPKQKEDDDHFGSEWVLVSRDADVINGLRRIGGQQLHVSVCNVGENAWTDKGPNPLRNVVRDLDPRQLHFGERILDVLDEVLPSHTIADFRIATFVNGYFNFLAAATARSLDRGDAKLLRQSK